MSYLHQTYMDGASGPIYGLKKTWIFNLDHEQMLEEVKVSWSRLIFFGAGALWCPSQLLIWFYLYQTWMEDACLILMHLIDRLWCQLVANAGFWYKVFKASALWLLYVFLSFLNFDGWCMLWYWCNWQAWTKESKPLVSEGVIHMLINR